jgi:hypothetical protein
MREKRMPCPQPVSRPGLDSGLTRAPVVGQFDGSFHQGLEPGFIFLHLTYGLKPVPFKLNHHARAGGLRGWGIDGVN